MNIIIYRFHLNGGVEIILSNIGGKFAESTMHIPLL